MDSPGARILEILNYPLLMRCPELGLLIDRCSLKELQDIYPTVVNSIFGVNGGPGWGFRIITRNTHPHDFDVLYNFFAPLGGPMFRLCYRLLTDTLKYELPISYLPVKMQQMLESGRYSSFYSDIVNIDPFRRQIMSLSLNAFDYFMFHFALHGTTLLHRVNAAAMVISSEKYKSLYFMLTAEYLCTFLPSHPDTLVLPQLICGPIKTTPMSPMPIIQPVASPKYLLISALSHHPQNSNHSRTIESPRANSWRSESVLFIFIDVWLRLNVDDSRELPSNEFIRCARILIKQLHAFGNSADLDNTSMALLRQSAQPLMNSRMYTFLKSMISRWPLDSSFSDVLELWLSYIQPWRYTFNRDLNHLNYSDIPITNRYETFISENLIVYTQIFVQLIPRFERLELSTLKNVLMLFRLLKVFNQTNLLDILKQNEMMMVLNNNVTTLQHSFNTSATSNKSGNSSLNRSGEWKTFNTSANRSAEMVEDSYTFVFGETFMNHIENLLRKIYISKIAAKSYLEKLIQEKKNHYKGIRKYLHKFFNFDDDPVFEATLIDRQKIPDILEYSLLALSSMFGITVNESDFTPADVSKSIQEETGLDQTVYTSLMSDLSDQSITLSPQVMKSRSHFIKYTGDPALLPIMSSEFTFLVRFLHQVSCKLNIMFGIEMIELWHRRDIWGKLSRQILSPPTTTQVFDKTKGISMLRTEKLRPRICLRMLASYKASFIILSSFIMGYLLFNAPSYGFILLISISFLFLFLKALCNDIEIES